MNHLGLQTFAPSMNNRLRPLILSRSISTLTDPALIGQRAIITGASRGIGAAIALRFAQEGIQCILVGRNLKRLDERKEYLRNAVKESPIEHQVVAGDVGCEDLWTELRKEKKVDILVNAAGITHYSPLFVTNSSLLHEVIQTNLLGTILACRTVGKNMMTMKGGCIINIASILGLFGGSGSAAYAASKAGVIGLTRSLAAELGERNIRVNVIIPGYVETDMTEAMTPDARQLARQKVPLRRFGTSAEIADAALFLVNNKYANNCALNLDGGLSAT